MFRSLAGGVRPWYPLGDTWLRIPIGVEFRLGNRVMLGLGGGYAFMTDFSDPIGGEKNHSGGDFGLTVGILFGG
jgi:hypothetical protein